MISSEKHENLLKDIETSYWYNWQKGNEKFPSVKRLYYGHETCQYLLPHIDTACEFARFALDQSSVKLSLVTPFLSDAGIKNVLKLIDSLLKILGELEVICSDWGLLYYLSQNNIATPVIGRLLAGQVSDPRIKRIVNNSSDFSRERNIKHIDGTSSVLKQKKPSKALNLHYQSCCIDKDETIAYLSECEIKRCELSNVAQGINLSKTKYRYSLHVPDVLVSVMRKCPGNEENFNRPSSCPCSNISSSENEIKWSHPSFPVDIFRRDNALYYKFPALPDNLLYLPIDRIVYK